MIVPRVLFLGDPAAATPWVGMAKELARECYSKGIAHKVYRIGIGTIIRVENIFPAAPRIGLGVSGVCKVWIEASSAGGVYYQFITTGSEIKLDGHGYYKGSATAIKLPTDLTKLSETVLKGIATGSTIESYGDPEKEPTTDLRKITKVCNVNQVQFVPESVYYGYYLDGEEYKLHSTLAYASVCPQGSIYNAGLYMLSDHFNSSDVGYDLAPTILSSNKNPLGRMPDADWPNEACRVRIVSEEYGIRYFIVMADASCTFYCWPDQYDSNEYLEPPDSSYIEQQYKANVPATQVQSLVPSFPDWVYVPQGQRRDTDWPGTTNSGEPRYGWRFHPLGTKVVGTVLRRTEFTGEVHATRSTIGQWSNGFTCTPSIPVTFMGITCPLVSMHDTIESITFKIGPNQKFNFYDGEPIYLDCVIDVYEDAPEYPQELRAVQLYGNIVGDYSYDTYGNVFPQTETVSITITSAPWWLKAGTGCAWSTYNQLYRFSLGDAEVIPRYKDNRCSFTPTNMLFDAPGIVEFTIGIDITGPNKEDFDFSMTLVREQEPDDEHYYIAAGYLTPILNENVSYPEGSSYGDLIVANLSCYCIQDNIDSEVSRRIGYCGSLHDFLSRSSIKINDVELETTLFEFLISSYPDLYNKKRYDPLETELISWEGKLAHIDLSTLSFIYTANRDTWTLEDYEELTYPLAVKQRWLSRETGVRGYAFGQIICENGNTEEGFWDDLVEELDVDGFDVVQLSTTGSRHVLHSGISNLVEIFAQCIYYRTIASLPQDPYDDYSSFSSLGQSDFESFIVAGKQYALYLCGYVDSTSYSESTCDSMLSSYNTDYSTDLIDGLVIDRIVEIHDRLKVFYGSRSSSPTKILVMTAFNLVSSYDRPILSKNFGESLKTGIYNHGAQMVGSYGYDSDYFSFGGSGSSQYRVEDYPIGEEWLFSEWRYAIETQLGRQLVVHPLSYYAIYRKQPLIVNPVPDALVYYDIDTGITYSTFEPISNMVCSWTPYNASYNEDHKPALSDFSYETIDCIGAVSQETTYTHQQFYEQAFDKADGSIDDPETIIYVTTVYDPYYTVKYYGIVRHVGDEYGNFYSSYNFLNTPRLNGSAFFVRG